jgi:leucyl/phenylalanyl-tRNA---protein transferase
MSWTNRTLVETDFPYLDEHNRFQFPSADTATKHGIVGVGGNLSPGMLLSAYGQGVFPWYSEGEPLMWWNPDPRFVLFPERLHISKSLRRLLNKQLFRYTVDTRFDEVIAECSRIPRPGQDGTWITPEMIDGYTHLHRLGYAHSFEVWMSDELVGGLYGVSIGRSFFGESMFSRTSGASKAAFVELVRVLSPRGFQLIDCQVYTDHLASLGATDIPRRDFLEALRTGLQADTLIGNWSYLRAGFP